ncbi:ATP-binding protein [Actinoplanes rectilineatus]|uniref:ATP-binding protein n=1 Tax=Actinoplanes rectilineatus TaxID=113571 RepID=UPI0005F278D7|nr:LuxR family transcriptional regulator [Actinoplanes rectilineatus]
MADEAGLLGRADELRRVTGLLADLPERGAALILRGDAGIGKSALLSRATEVAGKSGVRVLSTTGVEAESHLDFAGLHQLLSPVLDLVEELAGPLRTAILTAFGLAAAAPPDLFLIALASLGLLAEAAARQPVLVVVDDAHWLDPASAAALTFLARRVAAEPIAVLLAARDAGDVPVAPDVPELRLTALEPWAAQALLHARAPGLPAPARAAILAAAQGNPLALVELPAVAGALDPAGPWLPLTARLEQAFSARLDDLPPTAVSVLRVAALNDGDVLAETLAAAGLLERRPADRPTDRLGNHPVDPDALQPAIQARLVTVDGTRIRFRHPLIRSAIHHRISGVQRLAVHNALATVLADQPERRLWHRARGSAGPDERIALDLQAAAARARQRGAVAGAVHTLEMAARLSTDPARRVERLLSAAVLATEIGRRTEVDRLLDLIGPAEISTVQQARTAWVRGRFDNHLAGSVDGAWGLVSYARQALGQGEPDLTLDLLHAVGLVCAWSEPGPGLRRSAVETARRVPVDAGDPRLLLVLAYLDPVECAAEVAAALTTRAMSAEGDAAAATPATRTTSGAGDATAAWTLATAANAVGEHRLCLSFIAPALTRLRDQGRLGLLTRALAVQGRSAANLADLGVAVPAAEETIRLAREISVPPVEALGWAEHAQIAALRGRFDEFEESAAQAELLATPLRAAAALATVQHARGLAALATGRYTDAVGHLLRIFADADPAGNMLRCWDAVGDLAEAAFRGAEQDRVRDAMDRMEAVSERVPTAALRVGLGYARALLAADDEVEDRLRALLATDLGGWPFVRARAQLVYGERLRRTRRRAESRLMLRTARDTFDALGTVPWGERARQELRAAGESSGVRSPAALDRLTPQELQIAQLAAVGLTNREIGQRLYVSHRTVSTHLHRIFPKLGVVSRAGLQAALDRQDAGVHPR